MTPGFAKPRSGLPWLPYGVCDRVIINAHNFNTYDSDAAAYIASVETADGASLAAKYKDAINAFIVGAKADGFWSAIKAACFLAGPATLSGALVPLVGSAPTNHNFVSGDYNRVTGLKGNGTNKYLSTNRNNNADPQDNQHMAVWVQTATTSLSFQIGTWTGTAANGETHLALISGFVQSRNRNITVDAPSIAATTGIFVSSRSSSGSYVLRHGATKNTITRSSQTPLNNVIQVFAAGAAFPSNGRFGWYSVGESLDVDLLSSRLTTYMAAIA